MPVITLDSGGLSGAAVVPGGVLAQLQGGLRPWARAEPEQE